MQGYCAGANTGLGYWTAHHIAAAHATVVLACRTPKKCDAAAAKIGSAVPGAKVIAMALDLSSFKSIRDFAAKFNAKYDKLNSLVLNAGVMIPPFGTTAEGLETQIGTNHFGHQVRATAYSFPSAHRCDQLDAAADEPRVAQAQGCSRSLWCRNCRRCLQV